jgi:hypothetical protein
MFSPKTSPTYSVLGPDDLFDCIKSPRINASIAKPITVSNNPDLFLILPSVPIIVNLLKVCEYTIVI